LKKIVILLSISLIIIINITGCLLIKNHTTVIAVGNRIARDQLIRIYEIWFDSPYEYMFDYSQDYVRIAGRSYSQFAAGINGILFYGGLVEGFADYLNDESSYFWSYEIIEKVSGIKVVLEEREFAYFNPDIIIWGSQNLIPDPTDRIHGKSCQLIYNVVFKRFFRLMTETYIYLNDEGIYHQERDLYYENVVINEDYGLGYLESRFNRVFPQYSSNSTDSPWTTGMAFGFWFRRSLDGTEDEIWIALDKMMMLYDGSWLEHLKGRYPDFQD